MTNNDIIYMDQAGYERLLAEIAKKKAEIADLTAKRRTEHSVADRDSWNNTGTADVDRQERILLERLQNLLSDLRRVQIIERQSGEGLEEEVVDLNDVVRLTCKYGDDEPEEETVRLVGALGDPIPGLIDASINSPLGNAIYRKKVGDIVSFQVEGTRNEATIMQITKEEIITRR